MFDVGLTWITRTDYFAGKWSTKLHSRTQERAHVRHEQVEAIMMRPMTGTWNTGDTCVLEMPRGAVGFGVRCHTTNSRRARRYVSD
jgi:hypothetical protein